MAKNSKRHLAPVPPAPTDAAPVRRTLEQVELPTGGRADVDGLLRELSREAFRGGLRGFSFELDQRGPRCVATVATHAKFSPEQLDQGRRAVTLALLALGILKPARPAEPPAADPDGAPSPPPAPQSSPSSVE